ncbi:hypothetical protein NDU88_003229, partial [Pleurodeles waltl]
LFHASPDSLFQICVPFVSSAPDPLSPICFQMSISSIRYCIRTIEDWIAQCCFKLDPFKTDLLLASHFL